MNEETFLPTAPSGTSSSRHKGPTSAFHHQQQGSNTSSSPATMMALTSLSRDQLVEVVRAHERHPRGSSSSSRNDQPQPQPQLQHQQPIILSDFSFTSPRVPKKAKHSKSSTAADDDLEGFLAKGKAELGVAGANSGDGATTDYDDDVLIVRPTTRLTASSSSASSVASRTASWQRQRGTSHSRSFRSFASGSTAAELDCLVSVATPPGLLRMYSSTRSLTTPGCTTAGASGGTATVRVVAARLSRPCHPCVVEQRLRSITVTEKRDNNNNSHSSSSNCMDETTDETGVAR